MIYFHNDYCEGCHPAILARLERMNFDQTPGYGEDAICASAAGRIRSLCKREDLAVHFLVGGTQTNLTVIDAALRPHQGVLAADTAHIHCHETGAVEATGHKVLALPATDGKITAAQVASAVRDHWADGSHEHLAQPKMVYLSGPTELGTLYSLAELEEMHRVCRENGLYLFLDGARLGYGLAAPGCDVTLPDLARLCDVFYIGGTKLGALFGEAVVIGNAAIAEDFRYLIKQHGGMLAKGWLLGAQFDELLKDDLFLKLGAHADSLAGEIAEKLTQCGYPLAAPCQSNQIFAVLPDRVLEKLEKEFVFTDQGRTDESHRTVRICTSWATRRENVGKLLNALEKAGN